MRELGAWLLLIGLAMLLLSFSPLGPLSDNQRIKRFWYHCSSRKPYPGPEANQAGGLLKSGTVLLIIGAIMFSKEC